jgi:hypothetical protein
LQIAQVLGAISILSGFLFSQRHFLSQDGYPYLLLNFGGSALLAASAVDGWQWGFILLNTSWGLVAAWSLVQKLLRPSPRSKKVAS